MSRSALLTICIAAMLSLASSQTTPPISAMSPSSSFEGNISLVVDKGSDDLQEAYLPEPKVALGFVIICTSSYFFAQYFPSLKLPKITGYLIMGILAGPFVLNLIPKGEIRSLRAVDETSLAFIAFAAGGKIYFKKMIPIRVPLMWICLFLIVLEYIVGFSMVMAVRTTFSFLITMDSSSQIAVALLAGALMIARSPSSALAIVSETRSKGRFTDIMLGVTILSDVAVLVIYNINTLIAEAVLSDSNTGGFAIVYFLARLGVACVFGLLLAFVLNFLMFWSPRIRRKSVLYPMEQIFKHIVFLIAGFLVYFIAKFIPNYMDALLTCMVTGIALTNISNNRTEFSRMIKRLDQFVYCAFFTLTGASLELDIMVHAFAIACVLVVSRVIALFVGSYFGGMIAGESKEHSKYAGFCYITQAGVTLGLAKEIHLNFPGWGGYFATMIIATVVLNQLMGPPLMRWALRQVGEAMRGDSPNAEKVVVVGVHPNQTRVLDSLSMMQWDIIEAKLGIDGDGQLVSTSAIGNSTVSIAKSNRTNKSGSSFALLDPIDTKNDDAGDDDEEEDIPLGRDVPTKDEENPNDSTVENNESTTTTTTTTTTSSSSSTPSSPTSSSTTTITKEKEENDIEQNNESKTSNDMNNEDIHDKNVETIPSLLGPDAWKGFMTINKDPLTSDPKEIQKYISWLLISNEPVNVIVILLTDPQEIAKVIQAFAVACSELGRTEILEIIVPVEDREPMEVRTLVDAPAAFGTDASDAVDVILVEKDDRVPMLLDMKVTHIRHRMKRERLGKQMFLPRSYGYNIVPDTEGMKKNSGNIVKDAEDVNGTVGSGDVELIDIKGTAI